MIRSSLLGNRHGYAHLLSRHSSSVNTGFAGLEGEAHEFDRALIKPRSGSFRKIIPFPNAEDTIDRAVKLALRATVSRQARRHRTYREVAMLNNMARVDAMQDFMTEKIDRHLESLPVFEKLHPFEQVLIELTLLDKMPKNRKGYVQTIQKVKALKKALKEFASQAEGNIRKSIAREQMNDMSKKWVRKMEELLRRRQSTLEDLHKMGKHLRVLQAPDVKLPTVLLAGAPNVGKSSLVREFSTGEPEISDYPFTTRKIIMGYFEEAGLRFQMTDTPGLMNRADENRNLIEKLAVASLQHLKSVVLFVVDLTEDCGTSVEDQLELRDYVREKHVGSGSPWIDVLSKMDMLPDFKKRDLYSQHVSAALEVSVLDDDSLLRLKSEFTRALLTLMSRKKPIDSNDGSTSD